MVKQKAVKLSKAKQKQVERLARQIGLSKQRLADERDHLRGLISEMDEICNDVDEGLEDIERGLDAISKLI